MELKKALLKWDGKLAGEGAYILQCAIWDNPQETIDNMPLVRAFVDRLHWTDTLMKAVNWCIAGIKIVDFIPLKTGVISANEILNHDRSSVSYEYTSIDNEEILDSDYCRRWLKILAAAQEYTPKTEDAPIILKWETRYFSLNTGNPKNYVTSVLDKAEAGVAPLVVGSLFERGKPMDTTARERGKRVAIESYVRRYGEPPKTGIEDPTL